jgi:NAD(P)-dependent dehydrogenase (short-subunit alcohol dehydrogenase family)
LIAINQNGLLYVTHAALPHLLAAAQDEVRGVADIVNIASIAGQAWANFGVYNKRCGGQRGAERPLDRDRSVHAQAGAGVIRRASSFVTSEGWRGVRSSRARSG